jgi:hypothetical protein
MGMEAADPILKITVPVFEPPLKTARYKAACARRSKRDGPTAEPIKTLGDD